MKKKIVYIAHPMGGKVKENSEKVLEILRKFHLKPDIIPIAPYLVSFQYLDDTLREERELGIESVLALFERRAFDELWLFGNRISRGMEAEILLAKKLDIPVVPQTSETEQELKKFLLLL